MICSENGNERLLPLHTNVLFRTDEKISGFGGQWESKTCLKTIILLG